MLKQRILTALVLLPLMLGMLFYAPPALWAAFAALIALLALWEYGRLCGMKGMRLAQYLGGTAFFMLTACAGGWQLPAFVWLLVSVFWLLAVPLWLRRKWRLNDGGFGMAAGWMMMLPFWFALLALRPTAAEGGSLLAVMLLVWIADAAAYFVGRACGKHKLAPAISPGKSWEGAVGGTAAACVYLLLARSTGLPGFDAGTAATLAAGLLLSAVSICGDLLESLFKRTAGVKDSGSLLPGHGGVYDRTDSLIAVVSVYAAAQALFGAA